ncbi:MAG: sulfur carrier protein ThiS adenylyltransferase ThiF [Oscillospiraceae bacterium]|nr:sulfur carrier protein ThiS adenylyltransferase ThiF [Oscillospiraceae bacterium]
MKKKLTQEDYYARNLPDIQNKLNSAKVAIAGLGGLGSNIAVMLARIGVGRLLLVDFDKVEASNLNRQHYTPAHIGLFKTEALKSQLEIINPFVQFEIVTTKITSENAIELFDDYEIVCEAFDGAEFKAELASTLLENTDKKIVAASGMNGFSDSNLIRTKKKFGRLYLCGDDTPPKQLGIGFMAPRVSICAGHQANMIARLILGLES